MGAVNFDQLGIQATQGVVFILVSENAFFPMYATLALIPQQLPLLRREYRAGMYPIHLYYIARILSLVSNRNAINIFPNKQEKESIGILGAWIDSRATDLYFDNILVGRITKQRGSIRIHPARDPTYDKRVDRLW